MSRRTKIAIIAAVAVVAAVLVVWGGLHVYRFEVSNTTTRSGESELFYIDRKVAVRDLVARLDTTFDVSSARMMLTHAKLMGMDSVRPGCFSIPNVVSDRELLGKFRSNLQQPVRLSFRYAKTLPILAGKMAPQLLCDSISLVTAMTDEALYSGYGFTPQTAIAMYLPDSYEVLWTISPRQLVARMAKEYKHFWNTSRLDAAREQGLTLPEVATLASIVCSETNNVPEMPTVAGLYLNRLRKGILLQSDPTVIFAIRYADGNNGEPIRRVLNSQLAVESPYNTYKYRGLPPGPICMPQKAAIDAVLHPAKHNYIFMCAKETFDGTHNFAVTMAEHTANARRYHKALNERGIKK